MSFTEYYSKIYLLDFELGYPKPKLIQKAKDFIDSIALEFDKPSLKSDIFFIKNSLKNIYLSDPILCLRCRISHSIYWTINKIYNDNQESLKIDYLSSLVLDDDGSTFLRFKSQKKYNKIIINWKLIKERSDLKKPFTLEILRTFDSNKSNLSTWTQRMVKGDANLKRYLRENNVQLLTKWPRIAGASKSKLEKSLIFNGFSNSKIQELLKLHNSFLISYRESKKIYIKEKGRQRGWEPDIKFLNNLIPPQKNQDNLDEIYDSIIEFDKKIKTYQEKEYFYKNNQKDYLYDPEVLKLVRETLDEIGKNVINDSINKDKKKWLKDKNREKCWKLYAMGLSQRDIAKECSHKQGWVSKLLKEKELSEIIALNTLVRLSKLQMISNLNKSPSELDKTRENLRNQILNPEQLGNRSLMQYWINEALKK